MSVSNDKGIVLAPMSKDVFSEKGLDADDDDDDPDKPWCYCNEPSSGEMIMCDSKRCTISGFMLHACTWRVKI